MISRVISSLMLLSLSTMMSCSKMYDSQFDCPPGIGIPCTSVTDIESMIVETDRGPDVLVGTEQGTWAYMVPKIPEGLPRKIWVPGERTECGSYVEDHYIYVPANGDRF